MDPVVDDGGAAAEPSGGPGHGDLAVGVGSRGGDVVGLAVPEWTARVTRNSSVAPVCQRIPIRTLAWSGSGSTVTWAIRVRSSRLRSLLLVAGACHSPGR